MEIFYLSCITDYGWISFVCHASRPTTRAKNKWNVMTRQDYLSFVLCVMMFVTFFFFSSSEIQNYTIIIIIIVTLFNESMMKPAICL